MSNTTSTTIAAGQTVTGATYISSDHVTVSGSLVNTTLKENPQGQRGTVDVAANGSLLDTTVSGQGLITVENGGTAVSTTLNGWGANLIVSAGATANHVTASDNAAILVSGGTVSDISLNGQKAYLTVYSNGNVNNVTALSGTQIDIEAGGQVTSATVSNGGWVNNTGGTLTSATIASGGSAFLDQGTMTEVIIQNGGELQVDRGTASGVGLKSGGRINFTTLTYDPSASYSYDEDTHTMTVTASNGTATITLDPSTSDIAPGQKFILENEGDNTLSLETCFLAGSMIQTPDGDVAIEDIRLGDEIVVYINGKPDTRPVVWTGKTRTTTRPNLADDEAGWPVRILKDALSDGVPYKDMLITAEHCLFFDGNFVPVRMLVNGRSIFYDTSISSYDYYHVETEEHAIIRADGMLTESYLDTGNRSTFRQEGTVITLRNPKARSWKYDAAAQLCVDPAFTRPLFQKLTKRAAKVPGVRSPALSASLTSDPDLHLISDTGAIIRSIRHQNLTYTFMLPANTRFVRLVSRASRPVDMIGPFIDDRRLMGVLVREINFITSKHPKPLESHLANDKPDGWYETDRTDCAWTNGHALLTLPETSKGRMSLLTIEVLAGGPYFETQTVSSQSVSAQA